MFGLRFNYWSEFMIDFKMGIVFDFVCDVLFIEFGIVILFK